MNGPEEREQRNTRAWLRIDLLIAIVALFISALTAAASLYQTHVIADQLSSSEWPYLGISGTVSMSKTLSYSIVNNGMGPAIVRTVVVSLDGKPVVSLPTLFTTLAGPHPENGGHERFVFEPLAGRSHPRG